MRIPFCILICFFILQIGCKQEDKSKKRALGKINSLHIHIDNQWWSGEVGDALRKKFAAPVDGLPQEEPLFTINQYPTKELDGALSLYRNIIIVTKNDKKGIIIEKNKFASSQNIVKIFASNSEDIILLLEEKSQEIIKKLKDTEIQELQKRQLENLSDSDEYLKRYKINLEIPQSYYLAIEKDNFLWIKKDLPTGNCNLLLYQLPLNSLNNTSNRVSKIIGYRDYIGKKFIKGKQKNTFMITEMSFSPFIQNITLNNKPAFETRGTWEMKNYYMSGPFVNYAIKDKKNKRILVIEGFCYNPSNPKRDSMFELEAIIKTLKINE